MVDHGPLVQEGGLFLGGLSCPSASFLVGAYLGAFHVPSYQVDPFQEGAFQVEGLSYQGGHLFLVPDQGDLLDLPVVLEDAWADLEVDHLQLLLALVLHLVGTGVGHPPHDPVVES